jgi:RHS repeat-associated protein
MALVTLLIPRVLYAAVESSGFEGMPGILLTHDDGGTASVVAGTQSSTTFTLTNAGTARTVNLSTTTCNGTLASCSVSPSSRFLNTGDVITVTVFLTGGNFTGTGTATLAAKTTTGTLLASASVTVTVTPSLQVSTAPHAGSLIDVSGCVADCFETVYDYTTPAYVSRDVPRSVTVRYRSGRAKPYGRIALDLIEANPTIAAMRLRLRYPNGSYVTFMNGSTSLYFARNTSGPTRVMAEFDASTIPTSANLYTSEVTSLLANGTQVITISSNVRIIVDNAINSPYGAGVALVGIQRAVNNFDALNSPDGVLITDGTGSASFFMGACSVGQNNCAFSPPNGDFSTLTTLNGEFLRKYPDGTLVKISQTTGVMTAVIDRFGTSTVVASGWNADFQQYVPLTITDPEQQVIQFYYRDAANSGTSYKQGSLGYINLRGSRYSNFGIYPSGDLHPTVDPDGVWSASLGYDAQHRLTSVQDRNGAIWNYTYRYGKTIDYQDAPTIQVVGGGSARPRTTYREYLSDLYMAAVTGGGTTQASAIAVGSALGQVTDAGNHTTQFKLDRWNQPISITDALSHTTTITRDTIGRPTQVVRFTGATDVLKYSGKDLVMTRPAGADSTNYRWSTKAIVIPGTSVTVNVTVLDSVWGPRQSWQQYVYAANGAIQSVKSRYVQGDPTLFTTSYTTDTYGRVLTATDNAAHVTKTFFNGRYHNADSTVGGSGQWSKTIYDVEGRDSLSWMSGRPKPAGSGTGPLTDRTLYDVLNRVVNVSDGIRPAVTYEYGPVFLKKVRDRAGQVFRRDYNELGWLRYEYDPVDTTSWTRFVKYDYDVDGELKTRTNRRGQVITTNHDALHRPTSVSSVSGTDNFGYSADGLKTAAWNAVSTDSSFFRPDGWRDSVVTRIAGQRFRTRYIADAYQRLDSIDISTGVPIQFAGRKYIYDPTLNVLNTIRIAGSYGATLHRNNEALLDGITYLVGNAAFRSRTLYLTTSHQLYRDRINNLNTNAYYDAAYGYDSLGRFSEWTDNPEVLPVTGGVNIFTYDGDRLSYHKRFTLSPTTGSQSCPTPSAQYGYNCASLSSVQDGFDRVTYAYDNAENRTYDLRQGGGPINVDYSSATTHVFDPGDRIKTESGNGSYGTGDNIAPFDGNTLTFERDLDGNLTRRYGASTDIRYGWDALGRLDTVKVAATGATAIYDYNAFGQLVRRRTNGTVDRHFLWEGDNLLAELNATATARIGEYVHWGLDQPLAILTGTGTIGEVNYHVQDALGNVKLLFNQLASAQINFRTEYSDWGIPVNTTWGAIPNRLLFKGMFYEGDSTRLFYARNRWYSPEFGGFISEDPLSIGGGLNTYAFAGGDPINGSDPFGLITNTRFGLPPQLPGFGGAARWRKATRTLQRMADVHIDPLAPCAQFLDGNPRLSEGTSVYTLSYGQFAQATANGFGTASTTGIAVDNHLNIMAYSTVGPAFAAGGAADIQFGKQIGNLGGVIAPTGRGGGFAVTGVAGGGSLTAMLNDQGKTVGWAAGPGEGVGVAASTVALGCATPPLHPSDVANALKEAFDVVGQSWHHFKSDAFDAMLRLP